MSGLTSCILRGEPAFLVAGQATLLGRTEQHEIHKLNTAECRIAVWDVASRSLVVFDTAALIALAQQEAIDAKADAREGGLSIVRTDPPSRL
ncbi:hypothetical protein [Rhodanobacter lindaniclasticus]